MRNETHIWLDSLGFKENYPGECLNNSFLDTYYAISILHCQFVHTTITHFLSSKYNRRVFIHYNNLSYKFIDGKIEGMNDEARREKSTVEDILILDDFNGL